MRCAFQVAFLCALAITCGRSEQVEGENSLLEDDCVVIEAAEVKSSDSQPQRTGKQFILGAGPTGYAPFLFSQLGPLTATAVGAPQVPYAAGPCYSSKGVLGRCMSFRACYPYFKLPELGHWDAWVLGMYDTCNYYSPQGQQMFGVCCTNPQQQPEDGPETPVTVATPAPAPLPVVPAQPDLSGGGDDRETVDSELIGSDVETIPTEVKRPQYPVLSNWPPPIPTHPPDHTIPPLPTHPPSPGFPGIIPTTPNPGSDSDGDGGDEQAWPPKPPTHKPTRPPYVPPTAATTESPSYPTIPDTAGCGAKNGFQDQERIVGGHNADVGEWPWIAALFNGGRQFCGGSLIDDVHILSAAHCVAHMSSWDVARLTVRLGDYNIKTNSEVRHIEKKVKRVVRHRGFDSRTLYNDIAILTMDSPVTFSKQIRPICLPSGSGSYAGTTATVIGWGSLRESGPQPAVLQEVNIPIWSNADCKAKYGPAAPGGIVDHMLCAGQANRDSCSGDSGGPLMINNGRWTQVGVVSWGIGCGKGQYPGVYTRVEKFLPWINKNLK